MSGGRAAAIRYAATGLHRAGLLKPISIAVGYAKRAREFSILTYHRVNDERSPFFPSLPTAVFEEQMRLVAGSYVVLPVEELVARQQRGVLPRNAVAITFDDGYRDNLTHAAPVLARYGLPASIFLATGFIGTSSVPWFDEVALVIKDTTAERWEAPWNETVSLGAEGERVAALERILDRLKAAPDDERRRAVEGLMRALGSPDRRRFKNWMLNWDEVHALGGLGFSIGAHTVSHPILARVSPDRARDEIVGSRNAITDACGRPPRAFAYPNGKERDYTPRVVELVREAGFMCAVTTRFGVNAGHVSPYELRRGGPWEHHGPTFALKLAGYRLGGS